MGLIGSSSSNIQATNPGISPYPPMTVAIWANLPANVANNVQNIISVYLASINATFNIHAAGPTGSPVNQYVMGSECANYTGAAIDGTASTIESSSGWTHLLGQFLPTANAGEVGTVKVFWQGLLVGSVTAGGPVGSFQQNDPAALIIVQPGSAAGNIQVAYPAVWKRILAQSEITALAANGDPRVVAPANLASFVSLNQASGSFPDLVTPSIVWVVTGSMSVVADPFILAPYPPVIPTPPSGGGNINPPFLPVHFPPGPPTVPAWEDGASLYANAGPVIYNGQGQTAHINTANPKPPRNFSPGAASRSMSKIP